MQSMVNRLRESEHQLGADEMAEMKHLFKTLAIGIKTGEVSLDQLKAIAGDVHEMDEMSATGGGIAPGGGGASFTPGEGMAYAQALDQPKKKVKKESKDKEPKLAAGKIKKNYAVDKFGFTNAPSIPNRPSTGGEQYKALWDESEELHESYSKFKRLARERDSNGQFHTGIGIVRKKLAEVNRMMEYLTQMKDDMTVAGQLKETKNTMKSLEKMTQEIKNIYLKHKKLK